MIVVTGATGKLGRLVVEQLLERVPASQIIAAVRSPENARDLAASGVQVRKADYNLPETLASAFAGAKRALLISSSEVGQRVAQHQRIIDAAKQIGVSLLVYTSMVRADTSEMALAAEHKATEEAIRTSGLPFVLLRNGWYIENYTENLASTLERGFLVGAAGDGRVAAATRADFAAAAVAVLTEDGHQNKVYELGGDRSFSMAELAAAVSRWAGREIGYQDLSVAEYEQALVGAGLPAAFAKILADSDLGIARGDLDVRTGDLHRLIGRDTQTLERVLAELPKP